MPKTLISKKELLTWAGENWYKTTKDSLPDEIIDAFEDGYKKGHNAGIANLKALVTKELKDNLLDALAISEKMFDAFEKKGVGCTRVSVRSEGFSSFNALFIVDKEEYLSDTGKWMYQTARKFKNKQNTPESKFEISFTLMPKADGIDELAIANDGYFMTYAPNDKKQA